MTPVNRREFLQATAATAALAALPTSSLAAPRNALPKTPTDKVTLGKTGIQVSLVGMGTGSHGSGQASNQTKLGVKGFTKVVRHALDRGVTLFDVADSLRSEVGPEQRLRTGLDVEGSPFHRDDRQAAAVDRDALAQGERPGEVRPVQTEAAAGALILDAIDAAQGLDQSR